jgi:hypothetical protein
MSNEDKARDGKQTPKAIVNNLRIMAELATADTVYEPVMRTEWQAADLIESQRKELEELREELERERIRLAACGVIAMSNTADSAKQAREMHEDYRSASAQDVANAVDKQMELRELCGELVASMKAASIWIKNCTTPLDAARELDLAVAKAKERLK